MGRAGRKPRLGPALQLNVFWRSLQTLKTQEISQKIENVWPLLKFRNLPRACIPTWQHHQGQSAPSLGNRSSSASSCPALWVPPSPQAPSGARAPEATSRGPLHPLAFPSTPSPSLAFLWQGRGAHPFPFNKLSLNPSPFLLWYCPCRANLLERVTSHLPTPLPRPLLRLFSLILYASWCGLRARPLLEGLSPLGLAASRLS